MPKLTDDEYLIRHEMLHRVWSKRKTHFGYLSYQQQRDLHDYYAPAKSLSNSELLAHRKQVTKQDESLPHRASRVFLRMLRPEAQPEPVPAHSVGKGKEVIVRPLARPEINIDRLAQALLHLAKKMSPEEKAKIIAEFEAEEKRRAA